MSEQTGRLIALLLAGILAVLLFGRDQVLDLLTVVPWLAVGLVILAVIYWIARSVFDSFVEDYRTEAISTGASALGRFFLALAYVGIAANLCVFAWVAIMAYLTGSIKDAWQNVPYFWVPILMTGVCFAIYMFDNWRREQRSAQLVEDNFKDLDLSDLE